MNTNKVIAILKELGFKPSIKRFEDRIIIQKAIYLLQLKGVKTECLYDLYVRGPYSPELTQKEYSEQHAFEHWETTDELSQKEKESIHELKEIFDLKASWLEVGATYAYFVERRKEDPIMALKSVKRLKPFFSETQVALGISKAKEFLFKLTASEQEEMKREFSNWESAPIESTENRGNEEGRSMAN